MRKLLWLVIFISFTLGVAQFLLPAATEHALQQALTESLAPGAIDVDVQAFPAVKLLTGKIDRLVVRLDHFDLQGFPLERAEMELNGFQVEPVALLGKKELEISVARPAVFQAIISQESLNKYLERQKISSMLENARFLLIEEQATLQGEIVFLGARVPVELDGDFHIKEGNIFQFIPERVRLQGFDLGETFEARLLQKVGISLDLGNLPFRLLQPEVKLEPGQLILKARVELNQEVLSSVKA